MLKKINIQELKFGFIVFIKKNWFYTPFKTNVIRIKSESDIEAIKPYSDFLYLISPIPQRRIQKNLAIMASVYNELSNAGIVNDRKLIKAINNLATMVLNGKLGAEEANRYLCGSPYIFRCAVRKMLLATAFSKFLTLEHRKVIDIAIAAFLADIALTKHTFISEKRKLFNHETLLVQEHPITAYKKLINTAVPKKSCDYILKHHENVDGSGYPGQLTLREIPLGARLIRIVDIYESLSAHRPFRRAHTPHSATEFIVKLARENKLDRRLVEKFICFNRHFPEGLSIFLRGFEDTEFRIVSSVNFPDLYVRNTNERMLTKISERIIYSVKI